MFKRNSNIVAWFYLAGQNIFWCTPAPIRDAYAGAYFLWTDTKELLMVLALMKCRPICKELYWLLLADVCIESFLELLCNYGVQPPYGEWANITAPVAALNIWALWVIGLWRYLKTK